MSKGSDQFKILFIISQKNLNFISLRYVTKKNPLTLNIYLPNMTRISTIMWLSSSKN